MASYRQPTLTWRQYHKMQGPISNYRQPGNSRRRSVWLWHVTLRGSFHKPKQWYLLDTYIVKSSIHVHTHVHYSFSNILNVRAYLSVLCLMSLYVLVTCVCFWVLQRRRQIQSDHIAASRRAGKEKKDKVRRGCGVFKFVMEHEEYTCFALQVLSMCYARKKRAVHW